MKLYGKGNGTLPMARSDLACRQSYRTMINTLIYSMMPSVKALPKAQELDLLNGKHGPKSRYLAKLVIGQYLYLAAGGVKFWFGGALVVLRKLRPTAFMKLVLLNVDHC